MGRVSLALVAAIATFARNGQESAAFEVVSVKPADPASVGRMVQSTPGLVRMTNLRLFEMAMSAWHLNRDQIAGWPKWAETDGWTLLRDTLRPPARLVTAL